MIVQRFAKWAKQASTKDRAEAATMLAGTLASGNATGADYDAVVASLTLLLDDPASAVRLAMAKALSRANNLPPALLYALAADIDSVATAIVTGCGDLSAERLVDLVAVGSPAARRAIAERAIVPLPVAAAIAESGEVEAALALCRNPGAALSSPSFYRLAERFSADGDLCEALLARTELPSAVRQTLMLAARDRLAEAPLLIGLLGAKRAGVIAYEAGERGTATIGATLTRHEVPAFAEHLRGSGTMTPSLLLRVLVGGDVELFTTLLVSLSGRSQRRVESIVAAGRSSALRALVLDCGLSEGIAYLFGEALTLWRAVARDASAPRPAAVPALLLARVSARQFDDRGMSEAMAILRQLVSEAERDAVRETTRAVAA
ncbi:DUF2336 domain-containing protein [Jiella sp. MQZ9-1]|uniref:DUF2336 domain-containing protein n=1 Tax=Jiella flava TaxID=2816857 RepID=A0A939FZ49_9HYPH|nr:DUF2336 domain-containing protein [Jiella flava]MBO0663391.1 DUF2336 domain-containing protein [Jiella flava]MCD2471967.1 DUF2336 domain-containing protein [Jiella flava]